PSPSESQVGATFNSGLAKQLLSFAASFALILCNGKQTPWENNVLLPLKYVRITTPTGAGKAGRFYLSPNHNQVFWLRPLDRIRGNPALKSDEAAVIDYLRQPGQPLEHVLP